MRLEKISHYNTFPPQLFRVGIGNLRAAVGRARRVPVEVERNVVAVELDLTGFAPGRVPVADEAVSFFVRELGVAR